MKKPGLFITFEGTDGVGKTTQIKLFKHWLTRQGFNVCLTREPGGGPVAEKIRAILLDPRSRLSGLDELFLYEAARVEHLNEIILPALKSGKTVLCDRFTDATLAYQGYARGLGYDLVRKVNRLATGGLKPHLTVLLDLPPSIGLQRARKRNGSKKSDRLENEGLAFQKKVRQGYLYVAKKEPHRLVLIKVQQDKMETQNLIRKIFSRKFIVPQRRP